MKNWCGTCNIKIVCTLVHLQNDILSLWIETARIRDVILQFYRILRCFQILYCFSLVWLISRTKSHMFWFGNTQIKMTFLAKMTLHCCCYLIKKMFIVEGFYLFDFVCFNYVNWKHSLHLKFVTFWAFVEIVHMNFKSSYDEHSAIFVNL